MSNQPIYLDYAAATPMDERVLAAMRPYFSDQFYNPSATYLAAKQVAYELAEARSAIAEWLGARVPEIIFTAGGTEANNLAIQGIMRKYPEANLIASAIEHESVLQTAAQYTVHSVGVDGQGLLDIEELRSTIDEHTVLVSVMYANNEVGTIEPIRDVTHVIADIRTKRRAAGNTLPIYFHTDAAQAANYLDLHVARLGVDLMTLNGGKIYGPKQSGVLYVKSDVTLEPLIYGGGQERGLRNGTENIAAAIGCATALTLAQQARPEETYRLQNLQQQFFAQLKTQIPNVVINGSLKKRLPNNVHVTVPGTDNERLLVQLDEAGILAAAGSACSASSEEPSHVLSAMGVSEADAQSSLRFSMGRQTTKEMVGVAVGTLAGFLK
jgi:cysteine desulfurase